MTTTERSGWRDALTPGERAQLVDCLSYVREIERDNPDKRGVVLQRPFLVAKLADWLDRIVVEEEGR